VRSPRVEARVAHRNLMLVRGIRSVHDGAGFTSCCKQSLTGWHIEMFQGPLDPARRANFFSTEEIPMAYKLDSNNVFNPMAFWTDLGLRSLEMTLSSTQNISEGVDRLARAGASAAASEQVESPVTAASEPVASMTSSGLELVGNMQKSTFDLMTRVWRQWMSAFGTLASLGSRGGETLALQNPWLSVMQLGADGDAGATKKLAGHSRRQQGGSRRRDHVESGAMEHAAAEDEPKRRSRGAHAKAKPRSRNR
jgi:hypothetical protein